MASIFSARELINVAIVEEHTGANFYRALADATDSAPLRDFALDVAKMEDEHEEKFRGLLEKVGDYTPQGESYEDEYGTYMAYLLEGKVFPAGQDGVELARKQEDDAQAVSTAMELERNALLFYQEMLQFIPEVDRPLLDDIIAEERQHLIGFARYRQENLSA
jgi:rubrerythrin